MAQRHGFNTPPASIFDPAQGESDPTYWVVNDAPMDATQRNRNTYVGQEPVDRDPNSPAEGSLAESELFGGMDVEIRAGKIGQVVSRGNVETPAPVGKMLPPSL